MGFLRVVSPERQKITLRRDCVYRIDFKKKRKKERNEVVIIKKMLTSFKRELTLKEINLHINENIFKVISR